MNQKTEFDLVCGMQLSPEDDHIAVHEGVEHTFCSPFCLDRFIKNPKRFLGTPLLVLRNVTKDFHLGTVDVHVLRGVNLHIWEGDFVAIIGASGSGKSTVLNMIGLLDIPTSGQILLNGIDVSHLSDDERAELRSRTFGFIFQQYHLIPWLTAEENVRLPLAFAKNPSVKDVKPFFEKIGLKERMEHRPFELSGGEQQRTALMRALVNDPKIVIGDEPTGNLDSKTGDLILELLGGLHKEQGRTLIIVTHDKDIARRADQILTIKDGIHVDGHYVHQKIYTD
jgi:ABC-type lipoprotein export system ATPase subunit/YHS domain-containing protein